MIRDILESMEIVQNKLDRADKVNDGVYITEVDVPVEDLQLIFNTLKAMLELIKHSNFEKSGTPFICGSAGEPDRFGLHEAYFICPTYGLDGMAVYTRTKDYSAPGY